MKFAQIIAMLSLSLCYSYSVTGADFYKWTDEKGVVHYGQHKPSNAKSEVISTSTHKNTAQQNTTPPKNAIVAQKKPDAAKQPAVKKIKKDPKICQQAKNAEMTLRSRPIVRKGGKVMTIDQKNKELEKLVEAQQVHC